MRKASEQTAQEEAALKEIERIRKNGFNPGDDLTNFVISHHGPERALAIMRLAAHFDRVMLEEVH